MSPPAIGNAGEPSASSADLPSSDPVGSEPSAPAPSSNPPVSDDWRARFAGEDTKALEVFSRYKTESDFAKAFLEQRTALSKRAEPTKLAADAKPEQIAEYRKGLGLPEIAGDAKPEAYMEAYGIAVPQGYEASEVEKGLLADFAKRAYEKGYSPSEVKGATEFFFQQQAAGQQAINKYDSERQQEWQGQLTKELGRDYEPTVAAASAYLDTKFADAPELKGEILHARLPGGGFLGDHPAFVKMVADLALQNGFTDRIEASSMESGGKSLEAQQMELEQLQFKDPGRYNLPETQQKLNKLIELRLSRGEIDETGEPVRKRRRA